ncbi:hypothetical protein SAMN02983003_0024 [Devosia enhydra]|uniref:Uncharacterized protein n=1 Tax=Devosia enhydra TaxID=665118 RepID=A0A1K2HSD3_9HYPH|nr:hypothetical protein [Devosia enhydra]SFZ80605.1 hypothetical protein SAMN02983003_0024 [Devosia enhydra]
MTTISLKADILVVGGGATAHVLIAVFGAGTAHLMASGQAMVKARPDAIVAAPPHYSVHTESEFLAHSVAIGCEAARANETRIGRVLD